jgi:hypothetical protein
MVATSEVYVKVWQANVFCVGKHAPDYPPKPVATAGFLW